MSRALREIGDQRFGNLLTLRIVETTPYERWECLCLLCGGKCVRTRTTLLYHSENAACDDCRSQRMPDPTPDEIREMCEQILAKKNGGPLRVGYRQPKVYKRPVFRR